MNESTFHPISAAFTQAGPRPPETASRAEKKNYAEALSRQLATCIANALRKSFPGITPDPSGAHQEAPARTSKGVKKLDINYSTPQLGLGLGVSIKTLNFRDGRSRRYTKNFTRVDNELRAEAMDYHTRQPYAVLAGVVFLPMDACDDARAEPSSFGRAVQLFRLRAGREKPVDVSELFESFHIALYDYALMRSDPMSSETCIFFDALNAPPRARRPTRDEYYLFDEFVQQVRFCYDRRNRPPVIWAD